MIEVMQEDREAAAKWCAAQPFPSKQAEAPMIAAGEYDHHSLVQAFAAHAADTRAKVIEECARVCEAEMPAIQCMSVEPVVAALERVATVIRKLGEQP